MREWCLQGASGELCRATRTPGNRFLDHIALPALFFRGFFAPRTCAKLSLPPGTCLGVAKSGGEHTAGVSRCLRPGDLQLQQWIVVIDARDTLKAQPVWLFQVDEQHADLRVR